MFMGKARSFRLTAANEKRLEELTELLKLDNPNMAFNRIIEDYHSYAVLRPALDHFKALIAELKR